MYFPFAKAGTPKRPHIVATDGEIRVEMHPTRSKDCDLGVRFNVHAREHGREVSHMGNSVLPLAVFLQGCGFTIEDCRKALEEASNAEE